MKSDITERDPLFDNAKLILILLMVFGHFTFENRQHPLMMALCNGIYSFHMPLFIIISGYFSKKILSQRLNDVTQLLIPYLVFEAMHYAFTSISGLGHGHLQFYYPTYQNWYLLSLFTWRLLIPYFRFINMQVGILIAGIMAVGAGFVNQFGDFLSLYRSFYLIPFFVLGYYLPDIRSMLGKFRKQRVIMQVLFFVAFGIILTFSLVSAETAEDMHFAFVPNTGYGESRHLLLRSFALITGFVMSFLFLFMIPEKKTFFTAAGKNTMTVFMLHMFIVWPVIKAGIPYISIVSEFISLLIAILITYILSRDVTNKYLMPLTDPVGFIGRIKKSESK